MRTYYAVFLSLILFVVYALFWIVLGSYYCYPTAEDIDLAALALDKGVFMSTMETLNTFDGRYTTNVLHGLNPLAFGWYYGHKIMPVITFSLFSYAVYFYLKTEFYKKNNFENGIFSIAIGVVFFSLMDMASTLYWMIVTFIYTYSIIFFLFFYSFFLKFTRGTKSSQLIFCQLFLFLSLGCNELFMIPVGCFLLYLFIKYFNTPFRSVMISLLLIYAVSCLLFVTSPGIANRMGLFENERNQIVAGDFISTMLNFTSGVFKLMYSIVFVTFIMLFLSSYKIRVQKSAYIIVVLLLILITTEVVFVVLMGESGFPQRTMPFFLSLAILIVLVALSGFSDYFVKYKLSILVLFVVAFLVEKHSVNDIRTDFLSGKLDKYKEVMDERYKILTQHEKENCIEVKELPHIETLLPLSIATLPIIYPNRSAAYWNLAYERYFDVDEVRLEGDTTPLLYDRFQTVRF